MNLKKRKMMTNHSISDGISFVSDEERAKIKEELAAKYSGKIRAKGYNLVVVPYIRPEKTQGGIIIADTTRTEDQFHSQICRVVDIGPLAYTDSDSGNLKWDEIS